MWAASGPFILIPRSIGMEGSPAFGYGQPSKACARERSEEVEPKPVGIGLDTLSALFTYPSPRRFAAAYRGRWPLKNAWPAASESSRRGQAAPSTLDHLRHIEHRAC